MLNNDLHNVTLNWYY